MRLKRARLADNLNEKIAQRPGPMELVEKNILPVDDSLKEAIIGEWAGLGVDDKPSDWWRTWCGRGGMGGWVVRCVGLEHYGKN